MLHAPTSRARSGRAHLVLTLVIAALAPSSVLAQQAPPSGDAVTFGEVQAPTQATPPGAPGAESQLGRAQALTRQLTELEQRSMQLEQERASIRTLGWSIGKYISWSAFGVLAGTALGQWGTAETVKEALEDGRSDKAYDVDGDGDVDHADERRARRVGRGLVLASLVPLGLGVYTTVVGRMRSRKIRALGAQLDDVRDRRRGVLNNLSLELGVQRTEARLGVRLAF